MVIIESAKPIKLISKESGIPQASTYRIIRELERQGILCKQGKIDKGVRWNLYKYHPVTGKNFRKIKNQELILN